MTAFPKKTILAVGGAHIDRRGRVSGRFVAGASNPGRLSEEVGGGVFNALSNAVRAGISASLVSLRGGDAAGEAVAAAIAAAGIDDQSVVFLDRPTPSYTALLDADGELIAGLADMTLYDTAFAKQMTRSKMRDAVAAADGVLVDANVPEKAIATLVRLAGRLPVFAIAVSPAKAVRLKPLLPRLDCLFMTAREAASLAAGAGDAPLESAAVLRQAGLARGAITAGAGPLTGIDVDGLFTIAPPAPPMIVDVTGAGDALAGVAIAALIEGMPLRQALRRGMAAALLTLASASAVAPFSADMLSEALALVPEAEEVA